MSTTTPDTIVLIHGFWVTPRSWEDWIAHYEAKGYRGARARVSRLRGRGRGAQRRSDARSRTLTRRQRSSSTSSRSSASSTTPPILMGHSAGGAFTQILLDHGFGAAGVAINSAPTEGVKVVPLSQIKSTFPVLKNPANHHKAGRLHLRAVALRVHQHVHRGGGAAALRAVPHPRVRPHLLGQRAREHRARPPGRTWVDYHNDDRAPLLFISGGEDHLMPPTVQQSNAKHYKSRHGHRGQGVRGHRTCCPSQRRLGGDRRLRARRGPSSTSAWLAARATPTGA